MSNGEATDWVNLAIALRERQHYDDALAAAERAVALDPHSLSALRMRANILQRLKRFEEAIPAYRAVLAVDANDAEAWNNLGTSLQEVGQHADALAAYERAAALDPKCPAWRANQGGVADPPTPAGRGESSVRACARR